jgi:hypothetical protein
MAEDRLQRRQTGLSITNGPSLTASQGTLAIQVHLTALNAKITLDEEGLLTAEFDRVFSRESPEAIQWAFQVWREQSPFFPAVSEIRKLVLDWQRGQREQSALRAEMDQRFLLEEGRKRGEVLDFGETVKLLKEIADQAKPDSEERERRFQQRMLKAAMAMPTIQLTEEQIKARRDKERAEIARYREHSNNEFAL